MIENPPTLEGLGRLAGRPPMVLRRRLVLVGSDESAQLVIRSRSIPRLCAIILSSGRGGQLINATASETVKRNGSPVRIHRLEEGDRLQFGFAEFIFHAGSNPSSEGQAPPPGELEIEGAGTFPLGERPCLIGSHEDANARIDAEGVAPLHGLIYCQAGKLHIRDLLTADGIRLNGVAGTEHELHDGDVLSIGQATARYRLKPISVRTAATVAPPREVDLTPPPSLSTPADGSEAPGHRPSEIPIAAEPAVGGQTTEPSSPTAEPSSPTAELADPTAGASKSATAITPRFPARRNRLAPRAAGDRPPLEQWKPRTPSVRTPSIARRRRSRIKASFPVRVAALLILLAAAGAWIWFGLPVEGTVDGRLVFTHTASLSPRQRTEFQSAKEGLLRQQKLWQRAEELLYTTHGAMKSGFLADAMGVTPAGSISWQVDPDGDRQALCLSFRSHDPAGDALRLESLLAALAEAARDSVTPESGDTPKLKLELLRTEAEAARARLNYLQVRTRELGEEIRGAAAESPADTQVSGLQAQSDEQLAAYRAAVRTHVATQLVIDQLLEMVALPLSRDRLQTVASSDPLLLQLFEPWARLAHPPTGSEGTPPSPAEAQDRATKLIAAERAIRERLAAMAGEAKKSVQQQTAAEEQALAHYQAAQRKLDEARHAREEVVKKRSELASLTVEIDAARRNAEQKEQAVKQADAGLMLPIGLLPVEKVRTSGVQDRRGFAMAAAASMLALLFTVGVGGSGAPTMTPSGAVSPAAEGPPGVPEPLTRAGPIPAIVTSQESWEALPANHDASTPAKSGAIAPAAS